MSPLSIYGLEEDLMKPIQEEEVKEVFDFNSPEDVLIYVLHNPGYNTGEWKDYQIEECTVIGRANDEVTGAASYEASYGGFLDYTIEGMIDCPKKEGYYVVEGVTGHYTKGDGWETDDDMDFYYENVRPATEEEIGMM